MQDEVKQDCIAKTSKESNFIFSIFKLTTHIKLKHRGDGRVG